MRRLLFLLLGFMFGAVVMIASGGSAETTVEPSADDVVFPECFEHQIFVGPDAVYTPSPACVGGVGTSTTSPSTTEVTTSSSSSTTTEPASTTTAEPSTTSTSGAPTTSVAPATSTTGPPTITTSPSTTTTDAPSTSTSTTVVVPASVASSTTTAPPSTSAPSTSTSSTSTTSTLASTTTTVLNAPGCGFASAAFCETFDAAHPVAGTRTGDLDPVLWGVSRTNTFGVNLGQHQYNAWAKATLNGVKVSPPNDVRIIGGKLTEAVFDNSGQSVLAMYPKQPFDIAGRTGTVVFDVSANAAGPHAAWPEFWWTDQPVPAPVIGLPAQFSVPRNGVGIAFAAQCPSGQTGVDHIEVATNYDARIIPVGGPCIANGSATSLNHVQLQFSATGLKVWMTAPGSTTLKLMASESFTMPMTRGVVWINDVHYNADKDLNNPHQGDHQFTWDNLGFDGPKPYRDLTFDVKDAGASTLGYDIPSGGTVTLTPVPVSWKQTPSAAYVNLNWFPTGCRCVPSVSVNGSAFKTVAWPFDSDLFGWETIAIQIDPAVVRTGTNTIAIRNGEEVVISNVNLVLIAAAPVP